MLIIGVKKKGVVDHFFSNEQPPYFEALLILCVRYAEGFFFLFLSSKKINTGIILLVLKKDTIFNMIEIYIFLFCVLCTKRYCRNGGGEGKKTRKRKRKGRKKGQKRMEVDYFASRVNEGLVDTSGGNLTFAIREVEEGGAIVSDMWGSDIRRRFVSSLGSS